MKNKKNRISKLERILGVPEEVIASTPKITNLGFKKIWIQNYKTIMEYQDIFIRISTSIGLINISGLNLKMEEMTTDDILIEGKIDSIEFEEIEEQEENLNIQGVLKGYVYICVEGFYIEKIINACKKNNITLINLNRKSNTIMYANIDVKFFRKFSKIVKSNKCKMKIIKKHGIPFIIKKYEKRKIFVLALLFLCVGILALSQFIWNIEIIGDESLKKVVIDIAKEEGLDTGKLKKSVDLEKIINRIRIEREDIAWVGIRMKGTDVKIEFIKVDDVPNIINENDYCNIVAKKDAIVEKIVAQNGTLQVHEGDEVKSGDVLISGTMEGKYTGVQNVHPVGTVIGKVLYKERARGYYKQCKKIQTGNVENKYAIKLNKFAIFFSKKLSKFEIYDTIRAGKKLKISSNFYLPIQFEKITNYEVKNEEIEYTVDEAKEQAINEAKKKLNDSIGENEGIVNVYINTDENEEYVDVEVTYEVLEDIGTEEKIAL